MTALLAKDLYIQKKFIFAGFFIIWVFFILLGAFNDMSLALPATIYSQFGKQLIQMLNVIVIVVLGLGLLIISKLDSLNGGYLTQLTETLQSWSHYELVGAMIAFQIVFMGISYLISLRIYDCRDL